jgi:hypothetical protein
LLMKENSRCSILFHLLVPGGKCDTLSVFPNSFDNSCSLVFHSFTRAPLLPPESAVMYIRSARGYSQAPTSYHHFRMLSTANSAVSALIPSLTNHCQQVKKGEHYRRQRGDKLYPQDKPFLTLLSLAPKVFAKQKRFSATPTFFLQAVESLTC